MVGVTMAFKMLVLIVFITFIGCSPTQHIAYKVSGIEPISPSVSTFGITRTVSLRVAILQDMRQSVAENGILFVRGRETSINDTTFCINAEEHYNKNLVPNEVAGIIAEHFKKRAAFKSILAGSKGESDYVLSGKLKRLYGKQEYSSAAFVGSMFGLIGALATAGATTNGEIAIEITELTLRRERDGKEKRLDDLIENHVGELHADANCWCIYDNVNKQLKTAVERLAESVEKGIAEMEAAPQ